MRKYLGVFIVVLLAVTMSWVLSQPANIPFEERVESQEPAGNWQEPVVVAVQEIGAAIVKIETVREVVIDQFFFQFSEQQQGIGSGVIFTPGGYVLTNDHVIADTTEIVVRMPDGRSFNGEIVGRDSLSDLAVLRIEGEDLPVAKLGDSNELRVGQQVIAIGNPLGQDYSVTTGVVSALNRDLLIDHETNRFLEDMIQTDAAINPGNSGGPLLDINGNVVGINTAIIQQAQGIGFAIPSTTARLVAEQIIETGRPLRLGVLGGSLTPALANTIRRETDVDIVVDRGAFITRVIDDSPAADSGLNAGDVVVAVNGQEIAGMQELRDKVQQAGFRGKLELDYYRGDERRKVTVEL